MRYSILTGEKINSYDLSQPSTATTEPAKEWSGSPDPADPDNFWIDDETGERIAAQPVGEQAQPLSAWEEEDLRTERRRARESVPQLPFYYANVAGHHCVFDADGDQVLSTTEPRAKLIVTAVNEHSANQRKIEALTEALKACVRTLKVATFAGQSLFASDVVKNAEAALATVEEK